MHKVIYRPLKGKRKLVLYKHEVTTQLRNNVSQEKIFERKQYYPHAKM